MTKEGGSVIDENSVSGRLVKAVLGKIRRSSNGGEHVRLYNEHGVYNFYLQNRDGAWEKYNLDSGAAGTVFPVHGAGANAAPEAKTKVRDGVRAAVASGNRGQARP